MCIWEVAKYCWSKLKKSQLKRNTSSLRNSKQIAIQIEQKKNGAKHASKNIVLQTQNTRDVLMLPCKDTRRVIYKNL